MSKAAVREEERFKVVSPGAKRGGNDPGELLRASMARTPITDMIEDLRRWGWKARLYKANGGGYFYQAAPEGSRSKKLVLEGATGISISEAYTNVHAAVSAKVQEALT